MNNDLNRDRSKPISMKRQESWSADDKVWLEALLSSPGDVHAKLARRRQMLIRSGSPLASYLLVSNDFYPNEIGSFIDKNSPEFGNLMDQIHHEASNQELTFDPKYFRQILSEDKKYLGRQRLFVLLSTVVILAVLLTIFISKGFLDQIGIG